MPQKDKIRFLDALVLARLRYSLATVWLVTAQRRRLDGFMARCLRRILHIPSAYISRISNASVYLRAGVKPLSEQLLKHQLLFLRKVALSGADSPVRRDTFVEGSLNPQIGRRVRKKGRPPQDWTSQLLRVGQERMGSSKFNEFLRDASEGSNVRWKAEVQKVLR